MEKIVVCIPAYNPSKALLFLIESLQKYAFLQVVIVDDGSSAECESIFEKLRAYENVTVLQHERNLGKGGALKTGIHHIMKKYNSLRGVLTCGADGQHVVRDILRIAENARLFDDGLIIGMRNFNSEQISLAYRINNHFLSNMFTLLFRKKLLDFQSGLRFYPRRELSWIRACRGEGFDYDINVLIEAIRRKVPIYELPIGRVKMTKSSFLHYDEVTSPKLLANHLLRSFLRRDETFRHIHRK